MSVSSTAPSRRPPGSSLAARSAAALGKDGSIARALEAAGVAYEAREGQLQMAAAVSAAIEDEGVLLCEAGTGTGKTLAYLVPALLSGRRIVVSTATKALQEQIYTKDLPSLQTHLGVPIDAALMKGLGNYLCKRRLDEARKSPAAGLTMSAMLARIETWARQSETGDRAELVTLRDDDPTWHDVQSGSDTRIGQGCTFYDGCFVTKMRDAAQRARLVVVNHHLYLADLALRRGGARQGVIPDHDVVVFDEAHQLEDIATEFFGVRVSTARVESVVRDARRTLSAGGLLDKARGGRVPAPLLDTLSEASRAFFAEISGAAHIGEGRRPLGDEAWTPRTMDAFHKLDAALEALTAYAKLREPGGGEDAREDISAIGRRATGLRDDLVRVGRPGKRDVPWIDVRPRSCAIGVSPLDLSRVFRDELFASRGTNRPQTIILTSATLATGHVGEGGPFVHAKRRLGLLDEVPDDAPAFGDFAHSDRFDELPPAHLDDDLAPPPPPRAPRAVELIVPSPFDFAARAGVYAPLDLPEPKDPNYLARAGERVLELVRLARGGTFVLCASTRHMRALHALLREASIPYPLLCQGDAPKISLLSAFREHGDAVLVATMGFWEGVDVPGRSLRLVIIDKLPFAVPTDPVVAARHRLLEDRGRSAFAELSVPEAAIALKQGFGRLIRTRDDAGVVAILDKRIRTKGYGRVLRAALPPASPLHTLDEVRSFFEVVVGVGQGTAR